MPFEIACRPAVLLYFLQTITKKIPLCLYPPPQTVMFFRTNLLFLLFYYFRAFKSPFIRFHYFQKEQQTVEKEDVDICMYFRQCFIESCLRFGFALFFQSPEFSLLHVCVNSSRLCMFHVSWWLDEVRAQM